MTSNVSDDEEIKKPLRVKLRTPILILSALLLVFAFLFPLIICDILSSSSNYFKQFSYVSITGDSTGQSDVQFFFGLSYTLAHWDKSTFIPLQLFIAQWRAIANVTSEAGGGYAFLGGVSLALTLLLFVASFVSFGFCFADIFAKSKRWKKALGLEAVISSGLAFTTVIWFLIITVSLFAKIDKVNFSFYDFMAYGGIKMIIEIIFEIALGVLNLLLFFAIRKEVSVTDKKLA